MPRRRSDAIVAAMLRSTATCFLLAAALLALPAAANAAFSGSNGKLAWVDDGQLWVDDPYDDTGPEPLTSAAETQNERPSAPASPPAWSPDGTKIAFTDAIPDTSPYKPHTAVFTINADGTGRTQVTRPYPAVVPCDDCENGEQTWDLAPHWTPDGRVAFIRMVAADDAATHRSQVGTSLWIAGQGAPLAHLHPDNDELLRSFVWPEGSTQAYGIVATRRGFELRSLPANTPIARELGMTDLDASPDGKRLVYRAVGPGGTRIQVVERDGGPAHSFDPGVTGGTQVRFAPDGNGLLLNGCAKDRKQRQHCGWYTHRLPDPERDVRPDDPVAVPYLDGNPAAGDTVDIPGGRSMIDVQSQDLPVIYAPGFLGSEIQCGGQNVWMPAAPPIRLAPIAMSPDGQREAACPTAGPTGRPVDSFAGSDVYGHAEDWLRDIDPAGGFTVFGWDWRKAPQDSLGRLDAEVTRLLENDLPKRQGARRVAMAGHSYGGLLIRTYVDDPARAKRVARVLTVGSPWWGAPKPLMPLAFGVETPGFSALDLFIGNDDMRRFMRTIPGAYHLLPSDNYGGWLTRKGAMQDQDGVAALLWQVGASPNLFAAARRNHRDVIDGFFDDEGRIDVRAVVGVGLMTVEGVDVSPADDPMEADVALRYGSGDITVPVRSASQGPEGTQTPLGDPIHIQHQCQVEHMDQTKDEVLQEAYGEFLKDGRRPRKMPARPCKAEGKELKIYEDLPLGAPDSARRQVATAGTDAAGAPLSLADAERQGLADVMPLPGGQTFAVTNAARPVELTFRANGTRFEITDLSGSERGATRTYGPVTGNVVVGTGAEAPIVTVDGRAVLPEGTGATPAGPPADTAGPLPGGGAASRPAYGTPPRSAVKLAARLAVPRVLRVDRRGRVRVVLTAGATARGTLTVRDARGRRLGAARVKVAKAGRAAVTVTLSRAARARLRAGHRVPARLTLDLRSGDGRRASLTRTTRLRAR